MRKQLLATAHHSAGAADHDRTSPPAHLAHSSVLAACAAAAAAASRSPAAASSPSLSASCARSRSCATAAASSCPASCCSCESSCVTCQWCIKRRKHQHLPGNKCFWVYLGSFLLVDPALTMVLLLLLARRAAAVARLLRRKELVNMSRESHAAHLLVDGCERHLLGLQLLRQF